MGRFSMHGAAALVAVIVIMSCAEHAPTEVGAQGRIASLDVTLMRSTLVAGDSTTANATAHDGTGNVLRGFPVLWSSDNPPVATVTGDGVVHSVAAGSARIIGLVDFVGGFASVTVNPAPPPPVSSVSVSFNSSALTPGQSTQATALTSDANGAVLTGRAVTWSSDAPTVATVSPTGLVTAVAPGSAAITATCEGRSGTATLSVAAPPPAPVASVTVALAATSLTTGQSTQATAVPRDSAAAVLTDRAVTWSSSDPTIAVVSASGLVTAVATGAAIITATCEGRSASALVTVTPLPAPVASVAVSLNSTALTVGQSTQATAIPRDSTGQSLAGHAIAWSSTNPAIAIVSSSGFVTAVAAGSTDIVAITEGRSGSATISVAPLPPTPVATVTVALSSASLTVGESTQAAATTHDSTGTILPGRGVAWSSDNPAVATVSTSGMVSAVGAGATDIVATSEGRRGSTVIQVQSLPTQLGFAVPPAGAVSGLPLTTQPVVLVRDAVGNLAGTFTASVTVTITAGAGSLLGTTTVAAVNGVVVFTDLRIDGAGPHTLTFTAAGLVAVSANLTVTQTPATLLVLTEPAGATTGSPLVTQPAVQIRDNAGRLIVNSTLAITAALASGAGTLTGSPATAVDGVATFSDLRVDGSGSVTLAFTTASPALRVTSAAFHVAVGPAAILTMTRQPSAAVTSGVAFPTQPAVQLRDVGNNAVPQAGVVVTAAIISGGGALEGSPVATTDGSGLATFSGLAITGFDGPRTLDFSAPELTAATSATVTLAPPADEVAACPNEPAGFVRIQDQPWDVTPAGARASLGWIDDDGDAATRLSVVSDPASRYPSANHNVAAGLFRQGDAGGNAPFHVYRVFDAAEEHHSLYVCVYAKHSADFDNTNGNTGTKFLWPSGDQFQGTQTYSGHDGSNMDFQFFQQGAVDRRLAANLNVAGARLLLKRGQWVRYEMLLKANTGDSMADGELHVWIDGVKTHQFTDVQWQMGIARTWLSLTWSPTYGGGVNPVPSDQYQYIDHIHISGGP